MLEIFIYTKKKRVPNTVLKVHTFLFYFCKFIITLLFMLNTFHTNIDMFTKP